MADDTFLSRKQFLTGMLMTAATTALPAGLTQGALAQPNLAEITIDDLKAYEKIAGIEFTDAERKEVLQSLRQARTGFANVRKQPIDYRVEPSTVFKPLSPTPDRNLRISVRPSAVKGVDMKKLTDEDIAFLSVRELGSLIKAKQLSPVRLTEIYLERLQRYGDKLLCVVTLTPDLARRQAKQAEQEINSGHYRGPLHGIPYGIKDLFTVRGYPTTWGANTFEHQSFEEDATVVKKLESAGAILMAKLSMGALALGDVWFRGTTKNPWNPAQGSSGSSAGSASATAAGLVAFAIGTETLGSVMSPSFRCRISGLRPTYGRTSRYGGMALSYTMDKVGALCRQSEDCALVLAAMCGSDPNDPSAVDRSFEWPGVDVKKLKLGFVVGRDADLKDMKPVQADAAARILLDLGVSIQPVRFTPLPAGIDVILGTESSSAFEEFTRSGKAREMTNSSWPQTFREGRYVPAVEYLQAQRARTLAMHRFNDEFGDLDVILAPGSGGNLLVTTNYTGTPQTIIPFGVDASGNGISRSFFGKAYEEAKILAVARAVQEKTSFHRLRPDLSKL